MTSPLQPNRRPGHRPAGAARQRAVLSLVISLSALQALSGCVAEAPEERLNAEAKVVSGSYVVPIRSLSHSADGRHLLSGDDEGRIYAFDLTSGEERVIHTGHNAPILDATWTRDGRLISFGLDGAIRLQNAGQAEVASTARMPEIPAGFLHINPSGGQMLIFEGREAPGPGPTYCGPRSYPLQLADAEGVVMKYGHMSSAARCAAWSSDGSHMAFVEGDSLVSKSWQDRRVVFKALIPNGESVQGVAVTRDGLRAAVITRGELRLYELNNPDPLHVIGQRVLSSRSLPVLFTPDDEHIVALLPDPVEPGQYNLDLYNARSGAPEARLFTHVPETLVAISLSPDGEHVALAERGGRIHRARLADGHPMGRLEPKSWLGGGAAISEDGARIATCWQSEVQIRATETGALEGQFQIPGLSCVFDHPIALGPAGEVVLVGADERHPFEAYDRQGRQRATYERPAGSSVLHPAFSRNGQWVTALVMQNDRGRVFIWPVRGGAPIADILLPPVGSLRGLAITNDGRRVFSSFGHIQRDGRVIGEVAGLSVDAPKDGMMWSVADPAFWLTGKVDLTPDERFLLFTSEADEAIVLDTQTGQQVAQLVNSADTVWTFARFGTVGAYSVLPQFEKQSPRQPRHYINAIDIDPQGTRVVIAGYNQSNRQAMLEVFDLTDGDLLAVTPLRTYPRALHFDGAKILAPGAYHASGDLTVFNLTDRRMSP